MFLLFYFLCFLGWYAVGLIGSYVVGTLLNNQLNKGYSAIAKPFKMENFHYGMAFFGPINLLAGLIVVLINMG